MDTVNSQQLADEAQAAYNKGDYLSAARLFKAAADGFSAHGDELPAAEMANNCSVAFLKAGEGKAAFEVVRGTDMLFASRGDIKRQAMALGNQAAALENLGQVEDALSSYEKSAELLAEAGASELRAYVLQSLSALQLRRGKYLEAYATMRVGVMGLNKPNLQQKILKTLMDLPFKFLR